MGNCTRKQSDINDQEKEGKDCLISSTESEDEKKKE